MIIKKYENGAKIRAREKFKVLNAYIKNDLNIYRKQERGVN